MMTLLAQQGQVDFSRVEVLGSIPEGDSVRHVIARAYIAVGEISMQEMEVISFKKTGETWGILMSGKIKGMAQQIRKALEGKLP